jgi:hypothetical protein
VDNRVFLLGLDKLFRDAMKQHERTELLKCARRVARELSTPPAQVPVEGYYAEDAQLTEYFLLIRALQFIDGSATAKVSSLPEFERLLEVMSAPLFGRPEFAGMLLPSGRDALSLALIETFLPNWAVKSLAEAAHKAALRTDDFSLVGLAARIEDPVVLTALRETVVLYSEVVLGDMSLLPELEYVWAVDEDLVRQAARFVGTFNSLFGEELPLPNPDCASFIWRACLDNPIHGRCVRLGSDDSTSLPRYYHWAICRDVNGELVVHEFWKPEVWTTKRYRSWLRRYNRKLCTGKR